MYVQNVNIDPPLLSINFPPPLRTVSGMKSANEARKEGLDTYQIIKAPHGDVAEGHFSQKNNEGPQQVSGTPKSNASEGVIQLACMTPESSCRAEGETSVKKRRTEKRKVLTLRPRRPRARATRTRPAWTRRRRAHGHTKRATRHAPREIAARKCKGGMYEKIR